MDNVAISPSSGADSHRADRPSVPGWRELVWPREHGSWSLALEPVALGLLVAPSLGGAGLAVATVAAFFARRPLRTGIVDAKAVRRDRARRAAMACAAVAVTGWFGALAAAGTGWVAWLVPSAVAGAFFLVFDLQQAGREQQAEIAGALAFAWLSAVFAALAGWPMPRAAALGAVMLARAVPTVMTVRAWLRARKTGESHVVLPLVAALAAIAGIAALARLGLAPWTAVVFVTVFAVRSCVLLVFPKPAVRASTMGMIEAAAGIAFVVVLAIAWRM